MASCCGLTIERRAAHRPRLAERLAALARQPIDQSIDWPARVAALEARVAELEALIAKGNTDALFAMVR